MTCWAVILFSLQKIDDLPDICFSFLWRIIFSSKLSDVQKVAKSFFGTIRWTHPKFSIFHHLMFFDGPQKLMSFDGPKSRFSPLKISWCLQQFSKFSPLKTSCLLKDPPPDQNNMSVMSNNGPKTSCHLIDPWWFYVSTKRYECTKGSCLLMDPSF